MSGLHYWLWFYKLSSWRVWSLVKNSNCNNCWHGLLREGSACNRFTWWSQENSCSQAGWVTHFNCSNEATWNLPRKFRDRWSMDKGTWPGHNITFWNVHTTRELFVHTFIHTWLSMNFSWSSYSKRSPISNPFVHKQTMMSRSSMQTIQPKRATYGQVLNHTGHLCCHILVLTHGDKSVDPECITNANYSLIQTLKYCIWRHKEQKML